MKSLTISHVDGMPIKEQNELLELIKVYNSHREKNNVKEKYYEGAVTLAEVNLGIALPDGISKLAIGCEWGAKTVDVLASRSMFDGFVSESGNDIDILNQIIDDNGLIAQYNKACKDELKLGSTFATLST